LPVFARVRKSERSMSEGLIWVEVYLPFDPEAFAKFSALEAKLGSAELAAATAPDLADRALTPIDSHGEAMLGEDVARMARRYLADYRKVDQRHDLQPVTTVRVVESFVNGPEVASPNYWPGAWVVVLQVDPGSAEWAAIEDGTYNAVSFWGSVTKTPVVPVFPTEQA